MTHIAPRDEADRQRRAASYQKLVQRYKPRPPIGRNMLMAFVVGGGLCLLGQIFFNIFLGMALTPREAAAPTLAVMIFLGALATGFGIYDELAEIGGVGAAIPISGFSNTVTAAAMEFKREGFILGMGAKMFVIAGPVLVYGIITGFTVALIRVFLLGM